MAYTLTYWETGKGEDTYWELKHIRLSSIEEAFTLALPHNRPAKTSLITVERHRLYKGKRWISEKTVWQAGMQNPANVISRPQKTKR